MFDGVGEVLELNVDMFDLWQLRECCGVAFLVVDLFEARDADGHWNVVVSFNQLAILAHHQWNLNLNRNQLSHSIDRWESSLKVLF